MAAAAEVVAADENGALGTGNAISASHIILPAARHATAAVSLAAAVLRLPSTTPTTRNTAVAPATAAAATTAVATVVAAVATVAAAMVVVGVAMAAAVEAVMVVEVEAMAAEERSGSLEIGTAHRVRPTILPRAWSASAVGSPRQKARTEVARTQGGRKDGDPMNGAASCCMLHACHTQMVL